MNIDTTIYIKYELLEKVVDAAERMELSPNKIMIMLMRRVAEEKEFPVLMFSRTRNQQRDEEPGRRMHVWLPPQVYETWLDLRKVRKMSVSAVLASAIRKYLDTLIQESTRTSDPYFADNYRQKYFFSAGECDGLQRFTIIWGFPPVEQLEEYFT